MPPGCCLAKVVTGRLKDVLKYCNVGNFFVKWAVRNKNNIYLKFTPARSGGLDGNDV